MNLRKSSSAIVGTMSFLRPLFHFWNLARASAVLVILLLQGCTVTQEQLDLYTLEHSHSLNRVGFSGTLSAADGSGALLRYDEIGLDSPEFNYRPGLTLRRGALLWSLEQIHGQSESVAPFSAASGGLSLPAGEYSFDTGVTSTRLCQDWTLDLFTPIQSPAIHWLTGIDFVDYSLTAQSLDFPSERLALNDLVHVPFTGILLDWRLNSRWNLKGIFTRSWVSKSSGQPSNYEDTGVSLEWSPADEWRTHLSVTNKSLGFDHRVGGEALNLEFEMQCIEWGVTFQF